MKSSLLWQDPGVEDRKEEKLRKLLGKRLTLDNLSISRPLDFQKTQTNKVTEAELALTMPNELRATDFKLPGADRSRKPRSKSSELFRLWLWNMSYCPVRYKWKDLGINFWPRYLKVAFCPKKSCSYPVGMSCKPLKADKSVKLLGWTCLQGKKNRGKNCRWVTVAFSIVTKCSCSCTNS